MPALNGLVEASDTFVYFEGPLNPRSHGVEESHMGSVLLLSLSSQVNAEAALNLNRCRLFTHELGFGQRCCPAHLDLVLIPAWDRVLAPTSTFLSLIGLWFLWCWVRDHETDISDGEDFRSICRGRHIMSTLAAITRVLVVVIRSLSARWRILSQVATWFIEFRGSVAVLTSFG